MKTFWRASRKCRLFTSFLLAFLTLNLNPLLIYASKELRNDLFSVSFPNEKEGWACGRWGCVLHTSNGGQNWVRQNSGTDFTLSSICFIDDQIGWAVGDGGTIIHTEDGGKTWEKQTSPLGYFLMGVHFVNDQKGWIVTERTTILYTENAGEKWQFQFSDEDFTLKRVSFCDELHGWAVGEFGYIYYTDNGGRTWQHQAGYFDISDETGEMVGENFLFDVIAVDPRTSWVAGIDGYVAKTVDGGATWQKMMNGVPKTHLFSINLDEQGTILIGGNALLLHSSDGGETFRAVGTEPPMTYGWIYQIASRGAAGFVAVGKNGWVYLADSQGSLWRRAGSR